MYTEQTTPRPNILDRNRILIKGILVGFMVLAMLIPAAFVHDLVNERQQRQEEVVKEVSSKWAEDQTVTGPVLLLPYKEPVTATDGKIVTFQRMAYILPDELHINGSMQPTEKKRSLYSVMLYQSGMTLTGKFNTLPLAKLHIDPAWVQWADARLVMSVTDLRGIQDQPQLDWNGTKATMDGGVPTNRQFEQGMSALVTANAEDQYSFSVALNIRGSGHLYFTPVGKTTEVDMKANWGNPSFDGQYLPGTSSISDNSFSAHWKILPMSHGYPQSWTETAQDFSKASFGVRLIQPVDGYSKTNRSVKYSILFIALTFTIFFFLEILQKRQVHPLQYILVGLALTVFYTLLLSISEYTGFNPAYLVASVATVSLVGLYAWSIFKSGKTAIGFTLALSALYSYIFVLIQLEDYALLFGSIGLFVIIAIIMFYSRKIDWYGIGQNHSEPVSNSI